MKKIRVLLVEDHTIVCKSLRYLLEGKSEIEVVGEAKDGREAIEKVQQLLPDVVLMDIAMPVLNGLEATRQIKKQFSEVKVLILSMYNNEEYVFDALQAGASGYVIKQASPVELDLAMHAVYRGESFLSSSISKKVVKGYIQQGKVTGKNDKYNKLTTRERELLQLIAEDYSNREIAELLYISIKTVETHRAHLMEKLDKHSIVELTKYAIRKGVINLD